MLELYEYPSDESQKIFIRRIFLHREGSAKQKVRCLHKTGPQGALYVGMESRAVLSCQAGALRFAQ